MFDNSPTFQGWVNEVEALRVPKGRLRGWNVSEIPSGLYFIGTIPNVETLGYYRMSLRDRGLTWLIQLIYLFRFLVTLGEDACATLSLAPQHCSAFPEMKPGPTGAPAPGSLPWPVIPTQDNFRSAPAVLSILA